MLTSSRGCHTPSTDFRFSSLEASPPPLQSLSVGSSFFSASSAFSWLGDWDFLVGEMLRSLGITNPCSLSGVLSTELSLSSLGALRSRVSCRFTISSDEIAGTEVFLNDDDPGDGPWELTPIGLAPMGLAATWLAWSAVGEGKLSLPRSEPSLLGILGGRSLGLSIPLDEILGDGDSSPEIEIFPSPSFASTSSSVSIRMYLAGTKPSVPLIVPSHHSGLNLLNTWIMSPFLKDNSLEDRAE